MDGYWFWLHPTEKSVTSCQGEVTANPSACRQQSLSDCFQGHWGLDSSLPPTSPVSLLPSFTQVLVNHHLNKPIWPLLHIQILTALNLCVIVLLKKKKRAFSHKSSSLLHVRIWPFCYFQSLDSNSTCVPMGLLSMIALFEPEGNTGPNGSF